MVAEPVEAPATDTQPRRRKRAPLAIEQRSTSERRKRRKARHEQYEPYRKKAGVTPDWGEEAETMYRSGYSDSGVADVLTEQLQLEVSPRQVGDYLRGRPNVVRRPASGIEPYYYHGLYPSMLSDEVIETMCEAREMGGDHPDDINKFRQREYALRKRVDHTCYTDESLFNGEGIVRAQMSRFNEFHHLMGRSVGGENLEDHMAKVWEDSNIKVVLGPKNYAGADIMSEQEDGWMAMSIKSAHESNPSEQSVHISSLAPHNVEIETPEDCVEAIGQALEHLGRYERIIYLRNSDSHFPDEAERPAHRYDFLEVPHQKVVKELTSLIPDDFEQYFEDGELPNTFRVDIRDHKGNFRFSATVSRSPKKIQLGAIQLDYCDWVSSYWTEPIQEIERADRDSIEQYRS